MNEDTLQAQIAAVSKQLEPLQAQLNVLRETRKQKAVTRIAEIGAQVNSLLTEAETLSKEASLPFYRDTFVQGIEDGYTYDGDRHYWASSSIC